MTVSNLLERIRNEVHLKVEDESTLPSLCNIFKFGSSSGQSAIEFFGLTDDDFINKLDAFSIKVNATIFSEDLLKQFREQLIKEKHAATKTTPAKAGLLNRKTLAEKDALNLNADCIFEKKYVEIKKIQNIPNYRFMSMKEDDVADEKNQISEYSELNIVSDDEITVVGMLCSDFDSKLNEKTLFLETSREFGGMRVQIDIKNIKESMMLFPGQAITVFQGVSNELPMVPFSSSFSALVACGPFTFDKDLHFEWLYSVLSSVKQHPVHFCILMGPFVNIEHPSIFSGRFQGSLNENFENILNEIQSLNLDMKIILVPSTLDAVNNPIFPQPPFSTDVNSYLRFQKKFDTVSNPSMIQVESVNIALCSADSLFHLNKNCFRKGIKNNIEAL
ncbi:DNA polymerase alpha/epsilon, subunit B domain-containing protein [Rozella allomycis CSF55]|uniref:DNA polymerase alpha subunit B n=1 Tax=Rozella allomycis (strain CSF55) TaxID=988480 RepID=A0A075ARM2_ROZAC|nr:DNA polymerase alpha/epsilon, subunit B domain-containing protein [Rozella allomycis CSF55]|eukprot:EPZ31157.1 DNA polymerase alpha/epsilon, subunit B domain-containing protein [Rozella allomycis CSF55]